VLIDLGIAPIVLTKPDKPAHRGQKLQATPVKSSALLHQLSVLQPPTLKDPTVVEQLKNENPDLFVSIAYGEYIPKEILEIPKLGTINLHPSLLPKYRGAAPVQRALMAGETETGITVAEVTQAWDAGDILAQERFPIAPEDDTGSLLDKLADRGAAMLKGLLPKLLDNKVARTPQNHPEATFAPMIRDEERWIDWKRPADEIVNLIRGLSPKPGARARFKGGQLLIYRARTVSTSGTPGTVVSLEKEGPAIAAGEGALLPLDLLPENRKRMSGKDFMNGYHLQIGQTI